MAVQRFYPHRIAREGALQLKVSDLPTELIEHRERSIDAYTHHPEEVTLPFELSVDVRALAATRPESESSLDEIGLGLKIMSNSGRQRYLKYLPQGIDTSSYELVLRREDWFGPVDIHLVAVLRSEASPVAGYASDKGALLGWSEPLRLMLDEQFAPPSGGLDIEWFKFTEYSTLNDQHLFAMQASGKSGPRLLLNSDFPQAYGVLTSRGTRGAQARIRDATYMQIAHQGWSSLLGAAYGGLREACQNGEGGGESPMEELLPWQAAVLRDWALYLFPEETDPEGALEKLVDSADEGEYQDVLVNRLPSAINQRLRTGSAFEGLVRDARLIGDNP